MWAGPSRDNWNLTEDQRSILAWFRSLKCDPQSGGPGPCDRVGGWTNAVGRVVEAS